MRSKPGPSLTRFGLAAVLLWLALAASGDTTTRVLEMCRAAPGLDPDFARHLVLDDRPAFHRYAEGITQVDFHDAYIKIDWQLWSAPPDSYATRYQHLVPLLERIAMGLEEVHGDSILVWGLRIRRSLGSTAIELNRLVMEQHRLQRDVASPPQERATGFRALKSEYERLGFDQGVVDVESELARIMFQTGDAGQGAVLLRSALARARSSGLYVMVCQLLGEVASDHARTGHVDSMLACYREGIELADRVRITPQSARLRRHLASYYANEGRLAVAMDLAREAERVGLRAGGGPFELPTVLWEMARFADMGCWEIVRSLQERLPVMLRTFERTASTIDFQIYTILAKRLTARLLAAEGNPEEAATMLQELRLPARRVHGPDTYGPLMAELSDALLAAGRWDDALEVAGAGVAHADSFDLDGVAIRLALNRVRAALAMQEHRLAEAMLMDVRVRLADSSAVTVLVAAEYRALDAELALARGRDHEAHRKLELALLDLRSTVQRLDPGPHSYMSLARVEALRELAHHLLLHDPVGSYLLELDWRSLAGRLGRSGPFPPAQVAERAPALASSGKRTIHVVYGFTNGILTRWTHSSGSVRREALPFDRHESDRRVESLMRLISRDPDSQEGPPGDSLQILCSELGDLLLPPELRDGPPALLIVSAEGAIARLPFEALDVSTDSGYEPLLARHDVVYARPVPPRHRGAGDGTSIVLVESDAALGASATGMSLEQAGTEGERASARLPGARVLHSDEISKQAFLDLCSRASVVYVAAHLARDRVMPLLRYFPMRFGARQQHLDDSYLDLRDVGAMDLSRCELVVLSSCASGEPYVVGGRAGPSMADAVLDAGARAVIHTRWRVRDDRAAVVAPDLAGAWLGAANDPVSDWCARRRQLMRGPRGWRHPFDWAGWSVTVSLPTAPWSGAATGATAARATAAPFARAPRASTPGTVGSPH